MNIPLNYNWNLTKFAKENRKQANMTRAEGLIWNLVLKNKQLLGYKFIKQKIFWNYILDFYCAKLKLCIEIDDPSHDFRAEDDEKRTEYLESLWIKVVRYTNEEIYKHLEEVIFDLEDIIKEREKNE